MMQEVSKEDLLKLFEDRKFELVVFNLTGKSIFGFSSYYIFKNATEESILEFFKYIEKNTKFQPIKFYGQNEVSKSRLIHNNYDNMDCNPSNVIHDVIMALRFDIADKLLVGDYVMDADYLRMLKIIVCDDITINDNVDVEYERILAAWMVKKNYVEWKDLPGYLHPEYKGTFTKTNIDRLYKVNDDEFTDIPLIP